VESDPFARSARSGWPPGRALAQDDRPAVRSLRMTPRPCARSGWPPGRVLVQDDPPSLTDGTAWGPKLTYW